MAGQVISQSDLGEDNDSWFDTATGNMVVLNQSGLDDASVASAMNAHPELRAIANWTEQIVSASAKRRNGGMFERDRFVTPTGMFEQFKTARDAATSDDVISGAIDTTESMSINQIHIECSDPDEENIWNQWAEDVIDLEGMMHQMWRDYYTLSQFYVATFWGTPNLTVDGRTDSGTKRKKRFQLQAPVGMTMLDPLKVVPVGDSIFGQDQLAYIADRGEAESFDRFLAGPNTTDPTNDPIVQQLLERRYEPSRSEIDALQAVLGNKDARDMSNLFLMRPQRTFRHTATKPGYQRFADVRMKGIFELLDLKHQLRQMDRAHLVGGTNFIVVIKKGSDEHPAKSAEIAALQSNVKQLARVPVIVGDHRLDIEIITPKLDNTLKPDRYNTLDARITARMFQIFHLGGFQAGAKGDDSIKLMRVIARSLESQRNAMRKTVEQNIVLPMWRANDKLIERPRIVFNPQTVAIDFDPNLMQLILDLYDGGDVSRDTMHSFAGLNQDQEAAKREAEKENGYDEIFEPREMSQGDMGRRFGGQRNGGGSNRQSQTPNPRGRRSDSDTPNDPDDGE